MTATEKTEKTSIAVIQNDISYMKDSLRSLEFKFDNFQANYTLLKDFEPVKKDLEELKQKVWIAIGALSAITFLLDYVIKFVK